MPRREKRNIKIKGFTLIEMLLVMVIVSMIIYLGIGYVQQRTLAARIDRTAMQMQQILNAGLAYYIVNGKWPCAPGITCLLNVLDDYLPSGSMTSPWNTDYYVATSAAVYPPSPNPKPSNFYVYTPMTTMPSGDARQAISRIIIGKLPLGYAGGTPVFPPPMPNIGQACPASPSAPCFLVASANIPGQNLNNATAVNYAGLYHHGACVPAPQCPVDSNGNQMIPQIMVAPVSVSGVNDTANPNNVYPISSFTAYATPQSLPPSASPPVCSSGTLPVPSPCGATPNDPVGTTNYWRVCLQVVTEKGEVAVTNTTEWGQYVTLLAMTRCAVNNEPSGSSFTVWTR